MTNPWEVDVSKEDIATTSTSQAEEDFFGIKGEEKSMPASRSRRTGRTREEQKESESDRGLENVEPTAANLVIHSPRHLWGLGAIQFHFRTITTDEAMAIVADMQENFAWMEEEFADRLADVAALENQISIAQKELLTTLAEEVGEDLPDLTNYSKTEASKLIRELLAARGVTPETKRQLRTASRRPRETGRRNKPSRRPTTRKRTTGGRTGRRTGGGRRQFNNDAPGSATGKMKDFLLDLCRQAGVDAPTDDELNNQMTFNDVSMEITELREALGYEDN